MNELVSIEKIKAVEVFTNEGIEPILNGIKKKVGEFKPDITTAKGRKEIASIASKVSSSKTLLDKCGKELVAEWKSKAKVVDASRKKMREYLDDLRDTTRKPLNDWEEVEDARVTAHRDRIVELNTLAQGLEAIDSKETMKRLGAVDILLVREWEEFKESVEARAVEVKDILMFSFKTKQKNEEQAAELEALKKEKVEKEEALMKERREIELKLARSVAREKAAKEEAEAKKLAEEAAKKEAKRIIDEKKRFAEEKKKFDAARKKREKEIAEEAREAERKKIADAEAFKVEQAKEREADKKHRASINNEAREALLNVVDMSDEQAIAVVTSIAKGNIPGVEIHY